MTKILISPLNWGLGHAARCIPLIQAFIKNGAEVFIASDGGALQLLKKEFPKLKFFEIPGYNIDYAGKNATLTILRQSAKILKAVFREHEATEKIVEEANIDLVISDNRFGCFSKNCKSIFLTHQLNIISPNKILDKPVNLVNHTLMNNFDEIWVPDFHGKENLSGKLSHNFKSKKIRFIGPLSRMKKNDLGKKFDVIAVLSGPEPERTNFERKIFEQAIKMPQRFLVVRGMPERWEFFNLTENVEAVSFFTTNALNKAIANSDVLLSRSGYSTIMDLWKLEKPAILVPTPRQTEQEYLAEKFLKEGLYYAQKQNEFDLEKALEEVKNFAGFDSSRFPKIDLGEIVQKVLKNY